MGLTPNGWRRSGLIPDLRTRRRDGKFGISAIRQLCQKSSLSNKRMYEVELVGRSPAGKHFEKAKQSAGSAPELKRDAAIKLSPSSPHGTSPAPLKVDVAFSRYIIDTHYLHVACGGSILN